MRLIRLQIGGFRDGRDLRLELARPKEDDPALAFLVGPNGTGKSRVLEMLGRIFSHLSAGIPVGLDFELLYECGDHRVLIATSPPEVGVPLGDDTRLEQIGAWMLVADRDFDGWRPAHVMTSWPTESELDGLLPYRVVGLSAGPASRLDWALRGSALDSIAQRLDGGGVQAPPDNVPLDEWRSSMESEGEILREVMRRTANEPRCIALSGNELLLAILALLSHPLSTTSDDEARDTILARAGLDVRDSLRAFSFDIASDWRERLPRVQQHPFEELLGQAARRLAQRDPDSDPEDDVEETDQRAVFEAGQRLSAWIERTADSPFIWFSQLLGWLKLDALRSVRLVMKKRDGPGLLLDDDFSDGEFLLAGRYALLFLLREHRDCLILFDEPETHFNDQWKVDLISGLVRVLKGNAAQVVLATHSDLTLTDADRSDVYMLDPDPPPDTTEVPREPPVSPFAADRGEITTHVFGAGQAIGRHAADVVERALDSEDPAELRKALERTGPGFHSFRLRYALQRKTGMLLELIQSPLAEELAVANEAIVDLLAAIARANADYDTAIAVWSHPGKPPRANVEAVLRLPEPERVALWEAVRADIEFEASLDDEEFALRFTALSADTREAGRAAPWLDIRSRLWQSGLRPADSPTGQPARLGSGVSGRESRSQGLPGLPIRQSRRANRRPVCSRRGSLPAQVDLPAPRRSRAESGAAVPALQSGGEEGKGPAHRSGHRRHLVSLQAARDRRSHCQVLTGHCRAR